MKMDMNLFWLFMVLNVVNVVIQTIKSLATVKCGKGLPPAKFCQVVSCTNFGAEFCAF